MVIFAGLAVCLTPIFPLNHINLTLAVHNETENPTENEFLVLMSWISEQDTGLAGDAILDDLKQKASNFAQPFLSVFESLPVDTKVWHSRLSYWETRPWDNRNGTLTLVGDAAHPMTFRMPHYYYPF